MAYTIPAGNALNVDFATADAGYAAPAGNALTVNFTEQARNDCLRIDQKWSVTGNASDAVLLDQQYSTGGAVPDYVLLDQKWQVISYGTDPVLLDQKWSTGGVVPDFVRLNQTWQVLGVATDTQRLNQVWAVDYAPGDLLTLEQQWSVIGQITERLWLDGQWLVTGAITDTARLDSLWSVLGDSTDTIRLNADWSVLGSTPDTWRLNQDWVVEGAPTDCIRIDQQWAITAGVDTLALDQVWNVTGSVVESFKLGQQWAIEGTPTDCLRIDQQWSVVIPLKERAWLNQRWLVTGVPTDALWFNQSWTVTAPVNDRVDIEFIWATVGARVADLHYLNQQWSIPLAPIADRLNLNQQWMVTEVPTDRLCLDQTFDVEGTTNDLLRLIQEWATNSYTSDTIRLDQSWMFRFGVRNELTISYGAKIAQGFEFIYDLGTPRVRAAFTLDDSMTARVREAFTLPSNMGRVRESYELPSAINEQVRAAFTLPSPIRERVRQAFTLQSVIKNTDRVHSAYKILYAILNAAVVVKTDVPSITIRGQVIELASAEVSQDEGQFAWTCQCTLQNPAFYDLFAANDLFTVNLGGEVYSFIVDSKQRSRDDIVSLSAVISGISPTAVYADPRAMMITKTWDVATTASAIVDEVLDGAAVDWRVLDWMVPAFRLAVSSDTPISVAMKLAAAIGGFIETNPDGSLYLRYSYPVAVPDYINATPDQVYSDDTHKFVESENLASNKISDKLRIMDVATDSFADRIVFEASKLDPSRGILKVWPSPWRDTFTVDHTSLPIVSASLVGLVTEDFEETIEILRGEGNVANPIYALLGIEWLYSDLGGVVFDGDTTKIRSTDAVKKESLLRINYRTRYYQYDVVAFPNAEVQFLVLEPQDA